MIPILGVPPDMDGGCLLPDRNFFGFEAWIGSSVPGLAPNGKRTAARCNSPDVDGHNPVVAQMKGRAARPGHPGISYGSSNRVRAMAGTFISPKRRKDNSDRAAAAVRWGPS